MACDRRIATTQRERSVVDINDPAHAPHQPRARRRFVSLPLPRSSAGQPCFDNLSNRVCVSVVRVIGDIGPESHQIHSLAFRAYEKRQFRV